MGTFGCSDRVWFVFGGGCPTPPSKAKAERGKKVQGRRLRDRDRAGAGQMQDEKTGQNHKMEHFLRKLGPLAPSLSVPVAGLYREKALTLWLG